MRATLDSNKMYTHREVHRERNFNSEYAYVRVNKFKISAPYDIFLYIYTYNENHRHYMRYY